MQVAVAIDTTARCFNLPTIEVYHASTRCFLRRTRIRDRFGVGLSCATNLGDRIRRKRRWFYAMVIRVRLRDDAANEDA